MADNIDRTHVYNIMDWLEAEQDGKNKQSRVSELAAEIAVLRRDEVKRHTIALDEMYGAVVRTGHNAGKIKRLISLSPCKKKRVVYTFEFVESEVA